MIGDEIILKSQPKLAKVVLVVYYFYYMLFF